MLWIPNVWIYSLSWFWPYDVTYIISFAGFIPAAAQKRFYWGGGALNVDSPATDWQPVQGTFLPLIKLTAENGSPETLKLM